MVLELELENLFQNKTYSEKELRLNMAVIMYQRQIASLKRASQLAGVSIKTFEHVLIERNLLHGQPEQLNANERLLATLAEDDPLRAVIKAKPIRKYVTAEQLMKEQNYTRTNWERVYQLADKMAIEEPIELLLAQLKE